MKIDDRQVQQGISEESVLEYLNATPLFFERNLDVLESILIPQKKRLSRLVSGTSGVSSA